jgi:murein L,D-transpeptidase YafK
MTEDLRIARTNSVGRPSRRRVALAAGLGAALLLGASGLPSSKPELRPCDAPALEVHKRDSVLIVSCGGHEKARMWATFGESPEGAKEREGDDKTPEGAYRIVEVRKTPRFHVFMLLDYPNAGDRARSRTGSAIGVHGQASSKSFLGRAWIRFAHVTGASRVWGPTDGCIAVTNEDVEALAEIVQPGTPIVVRP